MIIEAIFSIIKKCKQLKCLSANVESHLVIKKSKQSKKHFLGEKQIKRNYDHYMSSTEILFRVL